MLEEDDQEASRSMKQPKSKKKGPVVEVETVIEEPIQEEQKEEPKIEPNAEPVLQAAEIIIAEPTPEIKGLAVAGVENIGRPLESAEATKWLAAGHVEVRTPGLVLYLSFISFNNLVFRNNNKQTDNTSCSEHA